MSEDLYYDENTLQKVLAALWNSGASRDACNDAITEMQNAGILFRERPPTKLVEEPPAFDFDKNEFVFSGTGQEAPVPKCIELFSDGAFFKRLAENDLTASVTLNVFPSPKLDDEGEGVPEGFDPDRNTHVFLAEERLRIPEAVLVDKNYEDRSTIAEENKKAYEAESLDERVYLHRLTSIRESLVELGFNFEEASVIISKLERRGLIGGEPK